MKTRFLFPHKFLKIGILIFVFGMVMRAASDYYSTAIADYEITHRSLGNESLINLITALTIIILIAGLLLIAFSKETVEDEQIAQLRLDCLQWAIYLNYGLILICVVVFQGWSLFTVLAYNLFTPLVIFIIRFRWKIYRNNSLVKEDTI